MTEADTQLLKKYMEAVEESDYITFHDSCNSLFSNFATEEEKLIILRLHEEIRQEKDLTEWLPELKDEVYEDRNRQEPDGRQDP